MREEGQEVGENEGGRRGKRWGNGREGIRLGVRNEREEKR